MIIVKEKKPVPHDDIRCGNCGSLLQYGNADLHEDYSAEKFISDCTRTCSNEIGAIESIEGTKVISYHEWLTPDQARRAVEIAREEMIDKFCEWVKKNVTYIHPRKGTEECIINLGKFKEAMKDE